MRRNDPIVNIIGNLKITAVIGLIKLCKTSRQIWGTIELHRDPISKVLSEW